MKSRNGADQAAVVVLRLVGNDVCSHNHDFSHMTQPVFLDTHRVHLCIGLSY